MEQQRSDKGIKGEKESEGEVGSDREKERESDKGSISITASPELASLTDEEREELDLLAEWLASQPDPVVSISSFAREDEEAVKKAGVPKQHLGANAARAVLVLNNGTCKTFDTSLSGEGNGSGGYRSSKYFRSAWSGHKHDAEVKLLFRLDQAIQKSAVGTLYVLGTSGPCESCAGLLGLFMSSHPTLNAKILYTNPPEESHTQEETIRYGWKGDKRVLGGTCFYHFIPAVQSSTVLSDKDLLGLKNAWTLWKLRTRGRRGHPADIDAVLSTAQITKRARAVFRSQVENLLRRRFVRDRQVQIRQQSRLRAQGLAVLGGSVTALPPRGRPRAKTI